MKVLFVSFFLLGQSFGYNYGEGKPAELSCDCGWRNSKRIVGGKVALDEDYPWMAVVLHREPTELMVVCGGTIITAWHVMTGVQCIQKTKAENVLVCVGVNDVSKCVPDKKTIQVAKVYNKEDFDNKKSKIRDISILLTVNIIKFTQTVGPACFPNKAITSEFDKESLKIMGWGFTSDNTHFGDYVSSKMKELDVQVVPWDRCFETYPDLDKEKTQICSHSSMGDVCGGDGGNPLVWLDSEVDRYTVIALFSYGPNGCFTHKEPSVNTDVTSFRKWVLEKVADKEGAVVCSKT